jgi:hypothetical protein
VVERILVRVMRNTNAYVETAGLTTGSNCDSSRTRQFLGIHPSEIEYFGKKDEEEILVGGTGFCRKQKDLRAGNYPCFRLIDLQKGKYQIGYEFTGIFVQCQQAASFFVPGVVWIQTRS